MRGALGTGAGAGAERVGRFKEVTTSGVMVTAEVVRLRFAASAAAADRMRVGRLGEATASVVSGLRRERLRTL